MSRTHTHGDKAKQRYYGDNWYFYRQEPKWWRKMTKHKRQRAARRQCVHQAMRGEENIHWPADKKPWEYYW